MLTEYDPHMRGQVHKRITYLGLAVEQGTEDVPDDGRFHVTRAGEVIASSASLNGAIAHMEVAEDEILAANPHIVRPRDLLAAERGFNDILSVRGSSRRAAQDKANQKGGKGGRGGV